MGDEEGSPPTVQWEVYIIEAENGKLYTGITIDLQRRFQEHQGIKGKKGASFFHFSKPSKVLYREKCLNRSDASKREKQIKKLSREKKLDLIQLTQKECLRS